VPTFNRREEIKELIESLKLLDFPRNRFEIIIADDGSTDSTDELISDLSENMDLNIIYLSQKNRGPGAARNMAMQNAKGDFFIFIDSDVTVPALWLKNIDQNLNQHGSDAFGGPDTFREDFSPLLKAINYTMTSFLTTGGMRGKKGKKLAKFYPRSFNMGLSKKLWQRIGGFGSLRHGQDIEYSHRIIKSGAKVELIDNAPVYHKRRTSLKKFYKQVFNWGLARINLYKLDSSMLEPLHAAPAVATLFAFVVICALPFSRAALYVFYLGLIIWVFLNLYMVQDASRMYKSIKPALIVPMVMPAQIFGYGLGFIYNYVRRVLFGKGEKIGFKKNYYK
jgi:glycosyltransferase involved in cell wall biosynthesis